MIKGIFSKFGRRKQKIQSPILVGDFPSPEKDSDHIPNLSDSQPDSTVVPLRSSPMVTKKRDNVEVFNEAVDHPEGFLLSASSALYDRVLG